jgi:PA14 domain/FG-GAP-like repeat
MVFDSRDNAKDVLLNSTLQANAGAVSSFDKSDFYKFQVNGSSSAFISLNALSADANVILSTASGQQLAASTLTGRTSEAISANLTSGTYYIQVIQSSGNTTYNLSLSSNAIFANIDDGVKWFTGDFNVDGFQDVIRQEQGGLINGVSDTQFRLGKADGSYGAATDFANMNASAGNVVNLIVGDFNGDKRDDVIRQEFGGYVDGVNDTQIMSFQNGNFQVATNIINMSAFNGNFMNIIAGDFNQDGRTDLIRQEKGAWVNGAFDVEIYLATGNWNFSAVQVGSNASSMTGNNTQLVVRGADIMRLEFGASVNGVNDVNFTTFANGGLAAFQVNPTGNFANKIVPLPVTNDFDGNGSADILWRHSTNGENVIWRMDGDKHIGDFIVEKVGDIAWKIVGTGDFDRDGKIDLLWRNSVSGDNVIWRMDGGKHIGDLSVEKVADLNWQIAGVADFNKDGKVDILWRNSVTGDNLVWKMDGGQHTGDMAITSVTDRNWRIAGVADFDKDGQTDILWRHSMSGVTLIWRMNGANILGDMPVEQVSDLSWQVVGTADFNKDGMADILWRNSVSGENVIWTMNRNTHVGSVAVDRIQDTNWKISGMGSENSAAIPVNQFRAEYFNNNSLTGQAAFTRIENAIAVDWKASGPGNGVGNDNFSVRWTGKFNFDGGSYNFSTSVDDGMKIWIDGSLIHDTWTGRSTIDKINNVAVSAGQHDVKVEYREDGGAAMARVSWEKMPTIFGDNNIYTRSSDINYIRGSSIQSGNNNHLDFQADGNLVVYNSQGRALWATGTSGTNVDRFAVQADGNMVLYAGSKAVWASDTAGNPGDRLAVQADGNVVVYRANGQAIFNTGTSGGQTSTLGASSEWLKVKQSSDPFQDAINRVGGPSVVGIDWNNGVHPWGSAQVQDFRNGADLSIFMKADGTNTAYWVSGDFLKTYYRSREMLGNPTSDRYPSQGGWRQDFEGGPITKDAQGGMMVSPTIAAINAQPKMLPPTSTRVMGLPSSSPEVFGTVSLPRTGGGTLDSAANFGCDVSNLEFRGKTACGDTELRNSTNKDLLYLDNNNQIDYNRLQAEIAYKQHDEGLTASRSHPLDFTNRKVTAAHRQLADNSYVPLPIRWTMGGLANTGDTVQFGYDWLASSVDPSYVSWPWFNSK